CVPELRSALRARRFSDLLLYPAELRVLETDFQMQSLIYCTFWQRYALLLLPSLKLGSGPPAELTVVQLRAKRRFANACFTQLSYGCWKLIFKCSHSFTARSGSATHCCYSPR